MIRMRGSGIAAGFGYFTPRSQAAKINHQITSSATLSQLASGPNAPPVSQAGPWKVAFKRFPCATCPLEGTPKKNTSPQLQAEWIPSGIQRSPVLRRTRQVTKQ